jgi:hypothetical protein
VPSSFCHAQRFSLDHLIGSRQHAGWDRQLDLLCDLGIYHQFKLRWFFHRQVGRLGSFEDFVHVAGGAADDFIFPHSCELIDCNGRESTIALDSHVKRSSLVRDAGQGDPKGYSAMAVLRYSNHYISVFLTPDKSGNSSCILVVEIRHKRDHSPIARLVSGEAFATVEDASARGFELGRKWIDDRSRK